MGESFAGKTSSLIGRGTVGIGETSEIGEAGEGSGMLKPSDIFKKHGSGQSHDLLTNGRDSSPSTVSGSLMHHILLYK